MVIFIVYSRRAKGNENARQRQPSCANSSCRYSKRWRRSERCEQEERPRGTLLEACVTGTGRWTRQGQRCWRRAEEEEGEDTIRPVPYQKRKMLVRCPILVCIEKEYVYKYVYRLRYVGVHACVSNVTWRGVEVCTCATLRSERDALV